MRDVFYRQARLFQEVREFCAKAEEYIKECEAEKPARIEVDRERIRDLIVKWAECKTCPLNNFNERGMMVCASGVVTKDGCWRAVIAYLQGGE